MRLRGDHQTPAQSLSKNRALVPAGRSDLNNEHDENNGD